MTCQQVQLKLSLYLYGELDFAQEEELERHLEQCAWCERALAREKTWHTSVNAESLDMPLDLLAGCREDLRNAVRLRNSAGKWKRILESWPERLGFSASSWSFRIAMASFLVFIGFSLGQFVRAPGRFAPLPGVSEMGLLNPYTSRIRDIQAGGDGQVRIIFDQVRERQLVGQADSAEVRKLLLSAAKDAADPGLQVDSVNILKDQDGDDVRDVLLDVVRHDANAGVRLKALEALRRYSDDSATRQGVVFVLEHDDNPGVRSQAIDMLAPLSGRVGFSPELANTLEEVIRSEQNDDYVHMRCLQVLQEMGAVSNVY